MRTQHDLSSLQWTVTGFAPFQWLGATATPLSEAPAAEVLAVAAAVPGSVQKALLNAGILSDWNVGLNARSSEWVENRHWAYEAELPESWLQARRCATPPQQTATATLRCLGLDYAGWVLMNGREVGRFCGSFTPHDFDLTSHLPGEGPVRISIVFDTSPRWLGQFGYTSQMTSWKPRFNYTWDWTSRLVQVGIWDSMSLILSDCDAIESMSVTTDFALGGALLATVHCGPSKEQRSARLSLRHDGVLVHQEVVPVVADAEEGAGGASFDWRGLAVQAWWPSGLGDQTLYEVACELLNAEGSTLDSTARTVGFRHIDWQVCDGAPAGATPWVCVVNGQPVFLQGVNWTPVRPNFADVTEDDTTSRLRTYRDLGCNVVRVWGGAYLEKASFYTMCDELGILLWQEFPLSSSGAENWPPEDPQAMDELCAIAESYISRRQHHACLLLWSGGNELQGSPDGGKTGVGRPVDLSHPLMARFSALVTALDPGRRFVATSASGPTFTAEASNFGKGVHWDVHGPWAVTGSMGEWRTYWANDDALFRSEAGCPGASPAAIIEGYKGDLEAMPCKLSNPLWRRTSWWVEWDSYVRETGAEPASLAQYVEWSQARQAEALQVAAAATKARFPGVGGFIVWMGHDSFPCTANTSILDFNGNPKPAAHALARVFRGGDETTQQ